MNTTFADAFLRNLVSSAPLLLIYLLGIVLTAVLWRRQPKASVFALLGLLVLLLGAIGSAAFYSYIMTGSLTWADNLFTVMGFVFGVAHAAGIGLLITGIFVGRSPRVQSGFTVLPPHGPPYGGGPPPVLPREP